MSQRVKEAVAKDRLLMSARRKISEAEEKAKAQAMAADEDKHKNA